MTDQGGWTPPDQPAPPPGGGWQPSAPPGSGGWQPPPPPPPPPAGGGWQPPPPPPPPPGGGWQPQAPSAYYPGGPGGQKTEPLSTLSLVSGILSYVVCPVIGGIVALITGIRAKKAIDSSGGTKTGRGAAQAGFILGLVNIVLGVLGIIGIVALGVAASKHTQYSTLKSGDCYNRISTNSIFKGEVDKVNCTQAHDTEVTGSFDASDPGSYPAAAGFRTQAEPQCTTLGTTYLGNTTGTGLRVVWLAPDQSTWDSGTHTVICGIQNLDGSRHTGSVKG